MEFAIQEFTPSVRVSKHMSFEPIEIFVVNDVQYSANFTDIGRFKEYVQEGVRRKARFVGLGDYIELLSPSNRTRYVQASLYDTAKDSMDNSVRRICDDFLNLVHATEGSWIALVEGHHLWEFSSGGSSDTYIAERLKATFGGDCCVAHLLFNRPSAIHGASVRKDVWMHHGAGGGARLGAPLTKMEILGAYFNAHVFLMAHTTRRSMATAPFIYWPKPGVQKVADRLFINCGGWSKSYQPHSVMSGRAKGSYAEKAMMNPTALGGITVKFQPFHREFTDDVRVTAEFI